MTLFLDFFRRYLRVVFLVGAAVFGFQMLMIRVFVTFVQNQQDLTRNVPRGIQQFFGIDKLPINTLNGFLSVAYQHPFLLATLTAVPVIICSGLLAGEVERRSLAFLISRNISRLQVMVAAFCVCIISCAMVVGLAVGGTFAGAEMMHQKLPPTNQLLAVAANLFTLLVAISGVSVIFASISNERSDAVGWTVTIILFMYVWSFLAQLWPPATQFAEFSLFNYYAPNRIFLSGAVLMYDYQLLAIVGIVGFVYGCAVYALRDFNV